MGHFWPLHRWVMAAQPGGMARGCSPTPTQPCWRENTEEIETRAADGSPSLEIPTASHSDIFAGQK